MSTSLYSHKGRLSHSPGCLDNAVIAIRSPAPFATEARKITPPNPRNGSVSTGSFPTARGNTAAPTVSSISSKPYSPQGALLSLQRRISITASPTSAVRWFFERDR